MKAILIYLITVGFSISLYAQDSSLVNESIDFVRLTFVITESNPMEKEETDLINNMFYASLKEYQNNVNKSDAKKVIDIFNILYQNGRAIYSDSDEERRMKLRRAACFASIALLSDIEKEYTFIQYAKFALSENTNSPNIEFIEEQYLGLLFIDVVFKYKDSQLNKNDLKFIREFININQANISIGIVNKAIGLLNSFEEKI